MMQLLAVKKHLSQVKIASITSLCIYFKAEPDTIRCLLRHLLHNGCVRRCLKKPACGTTCFKCPEIYEWIDKA